MSKGERWKTIEPFLKDRLHKAAERRAKRPTYDRAVPLLAESVDMNEAQDEPNPTEAFAAYGTVVKQSTMMAFADTFWFMGILCFCLFPLLFLMRRSLATGPVHID